MRPRIRSLKPEMWADEKIGCLSRDARLLLLGMVTMADDEGRFRARRSELIGHVFPADDDAIDLVNLWVSEIKEQGLVLFYLVDGTPYGAFRNWRRHQRINKPTGSTLPPPPSPKVVRDNSVPGKGDGTEHSGSSTGMVDALSGSAHSPTRRRAFRSDPDPIPVLSMLTAETRTHALAHRLAWHIHSNDSKSAPDPDGEKWQNDMRLLVCDRGGDEDAFLEIERIIEWCQADSFWRSNILSPAKLRKQFTQLVLKAGQDSGAKVITGRFSEYDKAAGL